MTIANEQASRDTTGLPIPDGVWSVEPERSEVGFAVKDMWGLRTVRGVLRVHDGALKVRAGRAAGELTIGAASLDTGNQRRDQHLRSPAFFDVEQHPEIVFAATAAPAPDGRLTVMGELAIGSSRTQLEIPVGVEQLSRDELRLEGRTTLSREAAGLTWNKLGMIRGDAMLHARLTLNAQAGLRASVAHR